MNQPTDLTADNLTQRVYAARRRAGIPVLDSFAGGMYTLAEMLYCQRKNDLPRLIMYAADLLACHGSSLSLYLSDEPFLDAHYLYGNPYTLNDALADLRDDLTPLVQEPDTDGWLAMRLCLVVACAADEMARQGQDIPEQLGKLLAELE